MNTILLWAMPSGGELIIIAVIILLLFGGSKIPQLMKGLGQGINEFKKGMKGTDAKPAEESKPELGKQ